MKSWKKVVISLAGLIFGILLLLFIFLAILLEILAQDMCGNEIFSSVISPDKKHKAVVFQRDCGATTDFSTQLSIIDANKELENTADNIFIIDGEPQFVAPKIFWNSDNELVVNRAVNGTEYKAETEIGVFDKIRIIYTDSDRQQASRPEKY